MAVGAFLSVLYASVPCQQIYNRRRRRNLESLPFLGQWVFFFRGRTKNQCERSGVRSPLALVLPPLLMKHNSWILWSTTAGSHSVCERAGCRKPGRTSNGGKPFASWANLRNNHTIQRKIGEIISKRNKNLGHMTAKHWWISHPPVQYGILRYQNVSGVSETTIKCADRELNSDPLLGRQRC